MMFSVTLLTPEGPVAQQQVERLHLPGEDGELDILTRHAPLIISLIPGVVSFHEQSRRIAEDQHFFIWGGLANVQPQGTMLLVPQVCPLFELNQADLEKNLEELLKKNEDTREIDILQAQIEALNRYNLTQFHFLSGALDPHPNPNPLGNDPS